MVSEHEELLIPTGHPQALFVTGPILQTVCVSPEGWSTKCEN
jgi:hypothetical protein